MNFLKSIAFGSGLPGNLPYELDKKEDRVTYPIRNLDLMGGKAKADGTRVSIFRSQAPEPNALTANALKRMKTLRHPNVLAFRDGAQDKTGQIAFVTEEVVPLRLYLEELRSKQGHRSGEEHETIVWGMRAILSALHFITVDCKLVHGNICPDSIFVTKGGDWKLGGFELVSELSSSGPDAFFQSNDDFASAAYKSPERSRREWHTLGSSPEYAMDMWSVGCLLYFLFNGDNQSPQSIASGQNIPAQLKPAFKKAMSDIPNSRISPSEMSSRPFFKTDFVVAMEFIENLAIKSATEKTAFYSQLYAKLDNFPRACSVHKILPALRTVVDIGGGNAGPVKLDPSAANLLPVILKIGSKMDADEFKEAILPTILRLFTCNDRAVRVQLLQQMDKFVEYLDAKVINNEVFDRICTGFSDTTPILRELTVKSMLHISEKLNDNNLNVKLMRYFAKLQGDPEPAIRTNTTICLGKIAHLLSEKSRPKVLFPGFSRSLRDPFPHARVAGLMAFGACEQYFEATEISSRVLPSICPLLLDPTNLVREQAFSIVSKYVSSLQVVSAKMKIEEDQAQKEAEEKQAQEAQVAANTKETKPDNSFSAPIVAGITKMASNSFDTSNKPTDNSGWGDDHDLDFGSPKHVDTSSVASGSGPEASSSKKSTQAGDFGWDENDNDWNSTNMHKSSSSAPSSMSSGTSNISGMKLPSTSGSANDGWGDEDWDFDEVPKKVVQSTSKLNVSSASSSKARLEQRKLEAKERREQKKQERGSMKLHVTKKQDGWDDWEI